jgi:hypothetical protein
MLLFIVEWLQRFKNHALDIREMPIIIRWFIYIFLLLIILLLGKLGEVEFIYFQF